MKTRIAGCALLLTSLVAAPGARAAEAATPDLTCRQAAALVQSRGAVTLATTPTTYDRYVSTRGYCAIGTHARPAYVPTRDAAQCYIGFYCSSAPPLFGPE